MLNVIKIIRSLISIAFVSTVHAATLCAAQLTYHSIGTKDGLASMFVLTLHQDANGFIWVGTYNGVSILGGNNAQVLYPERQELKDLQGSCVENIQSTDDGQVWIQNNFGMHLWDPRHNGLQHFYEAKGDNRCTVSPVGDVVVFTQQKGFLYFNKVKRQFLPLVVEHISWDDYLYMSIDRESRLTLFTRDERITYKLITNDEGSVTTELMQRQAHDTGRLRYAQLSGNDFFFIDTNNRLLKADSLGNHAHYCLTLSQSLLDRGRISSIVSDGRDLLISFALNGIIRMKRLNNDTYTEERQNFTCGVFMMMKDKRQDILWVASDGEGLCYSVRHPHAIHHELYHDLSFPISKPGRALIRDRNGDLWMGTKGDGLLCYENYKPFDERPRLVRQLTKQNSALLHNAVYAITPSSHDLFWIGSDGIGINYYSPATRQLEVLDTGDDEVRNIHALLEVDGNTLYAATNHGVFRIRLKWQGESPVTDSVKRVIYDDEKNLRRFISISRQGRYLWLACHECGLVRYDLQTERCAIIRFSDEALSTSNDIICVDASKPGNIFCGTSAGAFRLIGNESDTRWLKYNISELAEQQGRVVRGITSTASDTVWAATSTAIFCLDNRTQSYYVYNAASGLATQEIGEGACYYDTLTNIAYFGTTDGFVAISPRRFVPKPVTPPVIFYAVRVGNHFYDLPSLCTDDGTLRLHHNQNYFNVGYAAVDYIAANNYTFEYRLNDQPWMDNGSSRIVPFIDAKPGRYRLQVRYRNGAYLSPAYTLKLRILPPWWTSTPAIITYALVLLFIILRTIHRYLRRLQQRRQQEAEAVEKRHQQEIYESRLRFFIDLTHGFSTPLMLIEGPIQRILNAKPLGKEIQHYAQLIRENSRKMNELIQRVIEFRSYETGNLLPIDTADDKKQTAMPTPPTKLDSTLPIAFLVDENHEVLALLADVLHQKFNVLCFDSTEALLNKIAVLHPDIIIAETVMPHLGGIELCRRLKAGDSTAHIPIILLSTDFDPQVRTDSATAGADTFLTKPFDLDYFATVVQGLIQQRSQLKSYFNSSRSAFELHDGKLLHTEDREFLERIVNIIEKNLDNVELNAQFIADEMDVGIRNLYRRMQDITDETPKTLIQEMRLEHARKLLTKTGMTMEEVCFQSGYNNRGTFYRQFYNKFGCTPKQYHEQMMKNAQGADSDETDKER